MTFGHDQVRDPGLWTGEVEPGQQLEVDDPDHLPAFLGDEHLEIGRSQPSRVPGAMVLFVVPAEHGRPPELRQQPGHGVEVLRPGLPHRQRHGTEARRNRRRSSGPHGASRNGG